MQKSTEKLTGIIKDAVLLKNGCVYGTVVVDYGGRFDPGNWIRTSLVQQVKDNRVYTLNSIYEIEGELIKEDTPSVLDSI